MMLFKLTQLQVIEILLDKGCEKKLSLLHLKRGFLFGCRECEKFSKYGYTINSIRKITMRKLAREIRKSPFFRSYHQCPTFETMTVANYGQSRVTWVTIKPVALFIF